ncbi:type II toxin-antitoxin system RelE/ParE family toxin [Azospirillum ramasamyi]|uniref:type II toxin-antitoxin system RelE/ParE family toxin n=1 Tax=Azospirillum ramasamyi TaxID=682998 RepID=UPI003CCC8759
MIEFRQTDRFAAWIESLRDDRARMRIEVRIRRLQLGNPGDTKPVGEDVSELHIGTAPDTASTSSSVATR